ncbi:hypothetical protein PanWU01x14_233220 [Parasponia andersonii]|uniref:Uncharacterized protein n=1 Tax=Parasponia andersonii TaxID=3476 RepID=A0A2P5BJW0_PARAD|nr:hypothetical protein PanWU01x14_233220 [Parasponia andersonii]
MIRYGVVFNFKVQSTLTKPEYPCARAHPR